MKIKTVAQLEKRANTLRQKREAVPMRLLVCSGPGCLAVGAGEVAEALRKSLRRHGAKKRAGVVLTRTGCQGLCERGPLLTIEPAGTLYQKVKPKDADEIVEKSVLAGELIPRLLATAPGKKKKRLKTRAEIPFYKKQRLVALENVGRVDPEKIDDAIAMGAYLSLAKALSGASPEEVLDQVTEAGLRGRGGAGFPAGRKWRLCRDAEGEKKYVLCNCDEGDPGAFMDRSLFEGDPHRVLEGMAIGAYAIGADEGIIYIRDEYPLAVANTERAIDQARELGLLGKNILGTGFRFDVRLVRGSGAFVCGEETALLASVEGRVGEPVPRPPYPVESGLWGHPTNINNVETWANVPVIVRDGAKAFASIGTAGSKGTKVFCLVGKVINTGLIEVPMGATLREIVYDIGGGVPKGRTFKAVQTGGPSGGCLPAEKLDLPVDFESLNEAGSIMGSGGMIVMDDRTCMVDVAKYFTQFLVDESCGKCVPCREGLRRQLEILEAITQGEADGEAVDRLQSLGDGIALGSLCGLGKTAPNPMLSTLRYFREEYEAHISENRCPAGVCRPLTTFEITDECNGCGACVRACPTEAIEGTKKEIHRLDQDKCIQCGACFDACNFDAVLIGPGKAKA